MRGITCIRGRGERCGAKLRAETDEELLDVYTVHVGEAHADLALKDFEINDDVFITAYDVPDAE